ncbi:replication initiation protein [Photobacterium sp. OFAV2-7]|uniref:replication initiation protein n=1 Tax=Photobacterium sp. OFAV2-7 TaxID=2917748 RepID=UPI001EF55E3C|nr:replication initiation protein [Photobacterium sp. OFAV2-7]MCG7584928.1 replication initiation protein [Photobacterium sp. OFAV2-7]
MPAKPKHLTKIPDSLVIPNKFLRGRQDYTRYQRCMTALVMLGMQQERNRLYEIDPIGKPLAATMSPAKAREHYNNYIPSEQMDVNRYHTFDYETVLSFLGVKASSFHKTLKRSCLAITNKTVMLEEHNGKESFVTFVPIPFAEYKNKKLTLGVLDSAVPIFMEHSRGFSVVDLKIWTKLSSPHAIRLLELVSKDKNRTEFTMEIEEFRRLFGVDFKVYEDPQEAMQAGAKVGDYIKVRDPNEPKWNRIRIYPSIKDLRNNVLTPSFTQLLSQSGGVWSATDAEGLGHELLSGRHKAGRGRPVTHIRFCLKYNTTNACEQAMEAQPELTAGYSGLDIDKFCKEILTQLQRNGVVNRNSNLADVKSKIYSGLQHIVDESKEIADAKQAAIRQGTEPFGGITSDEIAVISTYKKLMAMNIDQVEEHADLISLDELHQLSINVSLLKDFGIALSDDFYTRLTCLALHKGGHIG